MAYQKTANIRSMGEVNGVHFYRIESDKFKTARTDIFFTDRLSEDTASANALVPALLKRGCEKFPTSLMLERKLEDLYGASLDYQVYKKGETQVIHMGVAHVADRYASGGEALFKESADLLTHILMKPVFKNSLFPADVFSQEKANLLDGIRSRINDKIRYASMRCIQEMCKGEEFAIQAEGSEESAAKLDEAFVTEAWRKIVFHCPAYVYLSGEINDQDAEEWINTFSLIPRDVKIHKNKEEQIDRTRQVQYITEKMDVNQGKLSMGFRTHVQPTSKDWPALMVYNGILGGDLHSKLFQNVREKASLAYYASSRLERNKELMFINSGIEAENREKAETIILEQFEDMKRGNISDDEFNATMRSLETAFKATQDSQQGIVEYCLSQNMLGLDKKIDELANEVALVSREDVIRVASSVVLDTVYFLEPQLTQSEEKSEECS